MSKVKLVSTSLSLLIFQHQLLFYCRKSHKIVCTVLPSENLKILTNIATTPLLRLHFAIFVILKFGLHLLDAKSLEEISHKPLAMDVHIQHEPANIKDFLRLFNASGWRDTPPMMGIPQIVDVPSENPKFLSDKTSVKKWTEFRERELAKRPGELTIVVCIHYHQTMGGRTGMIMGGPHANLACMAAGTQSADGFFKISPHAFEIAKQGTYPPIQISFEHFKYEWQLAPMNVENHIKCVANY